MICVHVYVSFRAECDPPVSLFRDDCFVNMFVYNREYATTFFNEAVKKTHAQFTVLMKYLAAMKRYGLDCAHLVPKPETLPAEIEETERCGICQGTRNVLTMPDGHIYHKRCLLKFLQDDE